MHERYEREVVPALMREFSYSNPMQVPRVAKVGVNVGVGEAIANSIALVRRHAGKLILFCLAAWLVYLLGAIVCFVGLLVSIPVAMVATAYMYRRIQDESIAA